MSLSHLAPLLFLLFLLFLRLIERATATIGVENSRNSKNSKVPGARTVVASGDLGSLPRSDGGAGRSMSLLLMYSLFSSRVRPCRPTG